MKTVIITGTSSGIGLELVKIFDSKGFNVISLSRNNLPNSINFSENVNHIKFDITKDSNIKSLVESGQLNIGDNINISATVIKNLLGGGSEEILVQDIDVKLEQLLKALFPILVTEFGIVIDFKLSHPRKALVPILLTEFGKHICPLVSTKSQARFELKLFIVGQVTCVVLGGVV